MKKRIIWTFDDGKEFGYTCEDDQDLADQIEACKEMGWAYRIEEV